MMVFGKLKELRTLLHMDTTMDSTPFSVNTGGTNGNTDGTNSPWKETSTNINTIAKKTHRTMSTFSSATTVLQHTQRHNVAPMTTDCRRNLTFPQPTGQPQLL